MSSALLWAPLAFGLVGLFLPRRAVGWWAVLGTVVTLGVAIAIAVDFDSGSAGLQYAVDEPWISGLGVDYSLGVDGLNVFLLLLTAVLWVGGTAFAAFREQENPKNFYFLMLVAETSSNPEWRALRPEALPAGLTNNHLGYALTWFGLALALVGVYAAMIYRRVRS